MVRRLISSLLVLPALAALVGCGSYRVVSHTEAGGTVALEGSPEAARAKAEDYIGSQCPFGYEVLPEMTPSVDKSLLITYRCKTPAGQPQAIARSIRLDY